ncbi:hypothetical protein [Insolitispirillum peregrinum]|uniref:hypothetical protein n=1 Tax=Insolitispirillum peregrinum TaxID=80876 RepID=UPI00361FC93B
MAAARNGRSREDCELELRRLQAMYSKLPPEKQAVHRAHMQARIDALIREINGETGKKKKGGGMMQTLLLIVLACVVALGAGFFGITYFMRAS